MAASFYSPVLRYPPKALSLSPAQPFPVPYFYSPLAPLPLSPPRALSPQHSTLPPPTSIALYFCRPPLLYTPIYVAPCCCNPRMLSLQHSPYPSTTSIAPYFCSPLLLYPSTALSPAQPVFARYFYLPLLLWPPYFL